MPPIRPEGVIGQPYESYRYGGEYTPKRIADIKEARAAAEDVFGFTLRGLDELNEPYCDFVHVGCPKCDNSSQHLTTGFDWSPTDPDRMRCRYCAFEYPSADFSMPHQTEIRTPAGTTRKYSFHLGEDNRRYYMHSALLHLRRRWLRERAMLLGGLFTETGDPAAATYAKSIILRFADIYDELPVHGPEGGSLYNPRIYEFSEENFPKSGITPLPDVFGNKAIRARDQQTFPYLSSRVGMDFGYIWDEIPLDLLIAYDQIRHTSSDDDALKIDSFFRSAANYVRSFPHFLYNPEAKLALAEVYCGRVIREPRISQDGLMRASRMLEHRFFADGTWYEGAPGYGNYVIQNLEKTFDMASEDPVLVGFRGFQGNRQGEEAGIGSLGAKLAKSKHAFDVYTVAPDGIASIYDTFNPSILTRYMDADFRDLGCSVPAESRLLWAAGHALLTSGASSSDVQVRLQFMGQSSHFHYDRLGISIHRGGQELAGDIGYTHTLLRPFATSTPAHNTVLVDERSQSRRAAAFGGRLLQFSCNHGPVQMVQVDASDAYSTTRTYRRALILTKLCGEHCYVLDVFDVAGGSQHDWILHGNPDRDETIEFLGTATPREAPLFSSSEDLRWRNERGCSGHGKNGETRNHLQSLGLFRRPALLLDESEEAVGALEFKPERAREPILRVHFAHQADTQVFCAETPSVRRAGESNAKVFQDWMPVVVLRRLGENLESQFVAVHEVCEGDRLIERVTRFSSGVVIRTPDHSDIHFWRDASLGAENVSAFSSPGSGEVKCSAPYAFVRYEHDKPVMAVIIGLGELQVGKMRFPGLADLEGEILQIRGREITVRENLEEVAGRTAILNGSDGSSFGIEIVSCARVDGLTRMILAEDPCLTRLASTNDWEHTSYPGTAFKPPLTYRISRPVEYSLHSLCV